MLLLGVFFVCLFKRPVREHSSDSSSLDDESCNNFNGDSLFHSISAGVFLTQIAEAWVPVSLCGSVQDGVSPMLEPGWHYLALSCGL